MKIISKQTGMAAFILVAALFTVPLKAQVTIGALKAPQSFSLLELTTTKVKGGLRLPLLTTAQRDALALTFSSNPAAAKGLVIYNTEAKCLQYWNGTKWVSFCIPLKN